ncbi:MAG: T9SS type A sorting domain-containing protein [Bacteroidales bacterium]|nr:T9SS type A sorting domain-containing protein [Bacteroidales bacterium]
MKKVLLFICLMFSVNFMFATNAEISMPDIDVTGLNAGDEVLVPITIDNISNLLTGFQFFIETEDVYLTWNGSTTVPGPGVNYIHPNLTSLGPDWLWNDFGGTMNQMAFSWVDPTWMGITITPGDVLITLSYTYNGGLVNPGDFSPIVFGTSKSLNPEGNKLTKGVCELYDEFFGVYVLDVITNGSIFIPIEDFNVWTGLVDDNWNNIGNWSLGVVPGPADNVKIPNVTKAPFPVISGSVVIGAITIFPGAQLTLGEYADLTTNGLFLNDGLFQILSDNTGYSGSFIDLGGIDPLSIGMFQFDRNTLGTSAPDDPFFWHYISAPVAGVSTDDIFDYYLNLWDEPTSLWVPQTGSLTIPCTPISPAIPLNVMEGWSIKEDANWGAIGCPGGTGQVIELMGPFAGIHTGAYGIPFTATGPDPLYTGYNLIGNPYPSSIDPAGIVWDVNMPTQSIYMWDGWMNTYEVWAGGVGAWIPPTQGFFVLANGAGTFNFAGTERVHNLAQWWWKSQVEDLLTLQVSAQGNDYRDKTYIRFLNESTLAFDGEWDAYKLLSTTPGVPQLYTTTTSDMLAINAQPEVDMVPMAFTSVESGTFTIEAIETSDFGIVILQDLVTGVETDLLTDSYTFDYTAGTTADRFIVHFVPLGIGELEANRINIWSSDNNIYVNIPETANGDIIVFNMMGQEMLRTDIAPGLNVIPMENVNTYYVVKVLTSDNAVTGKVYIK